MQLPENSIGISDILQHMDCARRMAYGMRRHVPLPPHVAEHEGERDDPPESWAPGNAYGSAVHEAIHIVDSEDVTDSVAVQRAMQAFPHWLGPEDMAMLKDDLATYHERDYLGVRTVASEDDIKVPLMTYKGVQYFFRFKLDRLYQRLDNEAVFIHIDYKSSKWPKSDAEVHKDIQMWAYNWAIHEHWPECDSLTQNYDQLRYGVIPTRKSAEQRQQMKEWLMRRVAVIVDDETLEPTANDWCPWCPIKRDCKRVWQMADWAKSRLDAFLITEPKLKQDGTPGKRLDIKLDRSQFDQAMRDLPKLSVVRKTIEKLEEELRDDIRALPPERRATLGWELRGSKNTTMTSEGKRKAHAIMGDDLYHVITMPKTKVENFYGEDKETAARVLDLMDETQGAPRLVRLKDDE